MPQFVTRYCDVCAQVVSAEGVTLRCCLCGSSTSLYLVDRRFCESCQVAVMSYEHDPDGTPGEYRCLRCGAVV